MTKSKEIEYEQAPSGYVKMYNYKEPFMPFREGYGFMGALVFDGSTDKIQCHFCGDWFNQLGNHLHKEHNMRASEYKSQVGLRQSTALINEVIRSKLIKSGIERFSNIRKGTKHTKETKDKISETLKHNVMEEKNRRGTCPMQLLDRLKVKARELGRTPTYKEVTFYDALVNTYGSFKEAVITAGLEYRASGVTVTKRSPKFTFEQIVNACSEHYIEFKNIPTTKLLATRLRISLTCAASHIKKYGVDTIVKAVLYGQNVYHKTPVRVFASKEELIELLKKFKNVHGRNPSTSDCKRGLLPHASRYIYHFKSFKNAVSLM
jgi:uncharacterized protein YaaR (DUF327 family)